MNEQKTMIYCLSCAFFVKGAGSWWPRLCRMLLLVHHSSDCVLRLASSLKCVSCPGNSVPFSARKRAVSAVPCCYCLGTDGLLLFWHKYCLYTLRIVFLAFGSAVIMNMMNSWTRVFLHSLFYFSYI